MEVKSYMDEVRAAGIVGGKLNVFNYCMRKGGVPELRDKVPEMIRLWKIQEQINLNCEALNEVLYDFIDTDFDTIDMDELRRLKMERRQLFEEREKLEELIDNPKATMELIKRVHWYK